MNASTAGRTARGQSADGDLLRPQFGRAQRRFADPAPLAEIDDADFETVGSGTQRSAPGDEFVPFVIPERRAGLHRPKNATSDSPRSERFDLFAEAGRKPRLLALAGPIFLASVTAFALIALASLATNQSEQVAKLDGNSSSVDSIRTESIPAVEPVSQRQAMPQRLAEIEMKASVVANVQPVETTVAPVSESVLMPKSHVTGVYAAPPARIERAGSILMIRSGK